MKQERGAIAIIIGVGMIMIVGFVAIAVDLGGAWAERRHVQSGADLAALAGAVEFANSGGAQAAVNEVLASVDSNVRPLSSSDWLPAGCTDSDALARTAATLGLTPASECISFNYDFSEIRVRVPPQTMDTSFAPVIGVDKITVGAAANAGGGIRNGAPPPFAVLDGFEAGQTTCLRTSSNIAPGEVWQGNGTSSAPSPVVGSVDPCDSTALAFSSEYMGTIDPPVWYADDGSLICRQNETAYQIAAGVDHTFARFSDSPTPGSPTYGSGGYGIPDSRAVQDQCGPPPSSRPNTVELTTGVSNGDLRCGLITARSGSCASSVPGPTGVANHAARLHQGDYVQSTYTFLGEAMDNEPLWNFLRTDIASVSAPAACLTIFTNRGNTTTWDYYDKRDQMTLCLNAWKSNPYDPIFSADIVKSGRFIFAPRLAEDNLGTGAGAPTACLASSAPKCVHIDDWVPIFVQTLYVEQNGLSSACDPNGAKVGRHHAGQEFSCGSSNRNV
ncbi:MAG: pilus assembly protein TadG-related protein, partial [Acidimicrobiales bacterium]